MPRSGTTWLARLLATSPRTGLAGREPMNPRGRQYALGGTLHGWAELQSVTHRQRRLLRSAYRGRNPLIMSRYGRRQWAAPFPWTRVVIKDPFAMLSVPVIADVTNAVTVLLFRHPGAALASYRRMGWQPDLDELRPVLAAHRERLGTQGEPLPLPDGTSETTAMGRFWAGLYEIALDNVAGRDDVHVVSHEDLTLGASAAGRRLFDTLGVSWNSAATGELERDGGVGGPSGGNSSLHDFDRAPSAVAEAWRRSLSAEEISEIEDVTAIVRRRLDDTRLDLQADRPQIP